MSLCWEIDRNLLLCLSVFRLYGHHLQHTLINVHITSIQFTTILFIGMQLSRLFPWWVHNLRYDTAFLPFLTRTLNMIFIVQHLTKLQIFTKIGMHSKNSTKASFTTYNRRSVAMKPNPWLQYSLVQNKALKSCWSSNLTHRPPHLLMLSNLLILIANIYSFIFHVYFRVRCAFPMFFPSVCKSISISSVFYRAVGTFLGYGNF